MENVINFADKKLNMPPKSTWFDPKPLDGLVAYDFEQLNYSFLVLKNIYIFKQ